ncbi:MAG TPA: S8 family serine peptidase [Pyrinomonadaceae bacterium]|nr:S8 family serine peptidase [Pyrinomonadaceae bacterium]
MIGLAYRRSQQFIALTLIFLLGAGSASAGITVTGADGITVTGADGISFINTSGITVTGADSLLTFGVNGITPMGVDGITVTGADGITVTGADATYTGTNSVMATSPDGITVTGADGITVTGADGITVTGADGQSYRADAVTIRLPDGITVTGADGITVTGADGITVTGADGITVTGADGITVTGADGITVTGADGITVTGADGHVFSVSPNGITVTGADQIIAINRANGIIVTGADGITVTGADTYQTVGVGLQSVDPELALLLDQVTDDSNINAVVVYHQMPTAADIADLQRIGVTGGTRYHMLPMITLSATREHLFEISHLPTVRSIYSNRTLQSTLDPVTRATTGTDRAWQDADLVRSNGGLPVSGRGVTVAVLDTGLDATHGDVAGRVLQNVKLADLQSVSAGFTYPVNVENVKNSDQVYGHGTFVAGVIAGNGSRSYGKYGGVAPGARLVGLSAGDLTLAHVLSGFDYLLSRGAGLNVRVVNCSFSAQTAFDLNDPVNVATKLLVEKGVNVVFSAGNTGPGLHTLNPYAVAPWVVSVGATDERGRLANFSSRGSFGSALFRPTVVAPGVSVVSLRSSAVSLTGTLGVASADTNQLSPTELPYYTTASGTSFSAPQVAGAIALMLEANPSLTPAAVRDLLQRTATPLPPYYQHEAGAGMLNVHAAVLGAAFPQRRLGSFRATLDRGQVRFVNDPLYEFSGTVLPGTRYETNVPVPADALVASVQVAWGPLWSTNDLGFALFDAGGVKQAEANVVNLPGLTGKRERVLVKMPSAGAWRIRVTNTLGSAGTSQPFSGVLEVTRALYAPLLDVNNLSAASRAEIYQTLRSFVMWPIGKHFRPEFSVSRADLAAALVLGGRVPQYLPAQPSYTDVRDLTTMSFVESVQAAPCGALFTDVTPGSRFRPDERVGRLATAVALVRAAGLRAEAEARIGALPPIADASAIPTDLRGYVAVAIERGLVLPDGAGYFRPSNALTRAELAHALVEMARLATQ